MSVLLNRILHAHCNKMQLGNKITNKINVNCEPLALKDWLSNKIRD